MCPQWITHRELGGKGFNLKYSCGRGGGYRVIFTGRWIISSSVRHTVGSFTSCSYMHRSLNLPITAVFFLLRNVDKLLSTSFRRWSKITAVCPERWTGGCDRIIKVSRRNENGGYYGIYHHRFVDVWKTNCRDSSSLVQGVEGRYSSGKTKNDSGGVWTEARWLR